jgi:N-acetyl-anhydromuramyl-L-alanine amidase AmpD
VGPVQQYRDTAYEADANLKANSFMHNGVRVGFASIETQGKAKGEWNPHQLDNIKALLKWLSETHDFPLTVCASPTSPGVGYHVMFGAPGPWTPHAKVCPGPDRVRQFENVLVPWFTSNQQVPPIGKGDMATIDELAAAEAKRYSDVRDLLQKLYDAEADRYQEYTRRFDSIAAALAGKKAA